MKQAHSKHFKHTNGYAQELWDNIREMDEFTIPQISRLTGFDYVLLHSLLGRMEVHGLIKADRSTKPHRWKRIADCGKVAPKLNSLGVQKPPSTQERIWMGIKAMKEFSIADAAMIAETTPAAAHNYIIRLYNAGYLSRSDAEPFKYKFRAEKNTGILSPSLLKRGTTLYDRNTNEVVWQKHGGGQ